MKAQRVQAHRQPTRSLPDALGIVILVAGAVFGLIVALLLNAVQCTRVGGCG